MPSKPIKFSVERGREAMELFLADPVKNNLYALGIHYGISRATVTFYMREAAKQASRLEEVNLLAQRNKRNGGMFHRGRPRTRKRLEIVEPFPAPREGVGKRMVMVTKDGASTIYPSIKAATDALNLKYGTVANILSGGRTGTLGYEFKYIDGKVKLKKPKVKTYMDFITEDLKRRGDKRTPRQFMRSYLQVWS